MGGDSLVTVVFARLWLSRSIRIIIIVVVVVIIIIVTCTTFVITVSVNVKLFFFCLTCFLFLLWTLLPHPSYQLVWSPSERFCPTPSPVQRNRTGTRNKWANLTVASESWHSQVSDSRRWANVTVASETPALRNAPNSSKARIFMFGWSGIYTYFYIAHFIQKAACKSFQTFKSPVHTQTQTHAWFAHCQRRKDMVCSEALKPADVILRIGWAKFSQWAEALFEDRYVSGLRVWIFLGSCLKLCGSQIGMVHDAAWWWMIVVRCSDKEIHSESLWFYHILSDISRRRFRPQCPEHGAGWEDVHGWFCATRWGAMQTYGVCLETSFVYP